MKIKTIRSLVLLLPLVAVGCGTDIHGAEETHALADAEPTSDWIQVTGPIALANPPGYAGEEATAAEETEWVVEALGLLDQALGSTDDWRVAEAAVERLLASPTADANPMLERIAPVALMRAHLLRADDAEAVSAIRRYTEHLIEIQSAETETVADGIDRLKGVVSAGDLSRLAARAIDVGEAWQAECSDCGAPSQLLDRIEEDEPRQVSPPRAVSLQRLEAMARADQ